MCDSISSSHGRPGLRHELGSLTADLNRQGAFYGDKVVCDATTTSQRDIDNGVVNVLVMFG